MNTKKLRLLLIPLTLLVVIVVINMFTSNIKGIDGNKWLKDSHVYMENGNLFLENIDNTLTLYLSGISNTQSYITDYDILKKQWKLLKADFEKYCNDNPILPDSQTVSSKMGYDAIHAFYAEIDSLFKELDTIDSSNSKHISYVYLAHQQAIVDHYTTYIITYNIVTGVYSEKQTYSE